MHNSDTLLFTCEHATAHIPVGYSRYFQSRRASRALSSPEAADWGALDVARFLSGEFQAPVFAGFVSRLLIDLDRASDNPDRFSQWSKEASPAERAALTELHQNHLARVRRAVDIMTRRARVVHISVHSFPARQVRVNANAHLNWAYAPSRVGEREWVASAISEQKGLSKKMMRLQGAPEGELRVTRSRPDPTRSESLCASLRESYGDESYLGLELQLSQSLILRPQGALWMKRFLLEALKLALKRGDRSSVRARAG